MEGYILVIVIVIDGYIMNVEASSLSMGFAIRTYMEIAVLPLVRRYPVLTIKWCVARGDSDRET